LPAVFDDGPEFFSLVMTGPDPQELIEIGMEFARVAAQRAVGEIWPSSRDTPIDQLPADEVIE
jgi:hypothetical protein